MVNAEQLRLDKKLRGVRRARNDAQRMVEEVEEEIGYFKDVVRRCSRAWRLDACTPTSTSKGENP
jgi:hypothetical protein